MSQSASTNSVLPTSGSAAPDSQIVTLGEIWVAPAVDPDMTELLTDTLKPLLQPLSIEAAAVYLTTNPDENTLQLCVFVPGQDIEPQDYQLTLSQEHPHVRRALNSAEPALADWSALGEAERMRGPQEASGPEDRMARLCCPIRVDNIPQGLLVMSMPTSKVHQPQWLPAIGQQVAAIVEQSQHLGDTKAQCAQLQREVTLRDGLNQAALAVSGKRDPSEIFHAITTRLAGMGFVAAIHIPRDAPSTEAKPPFDVEIVAVATPDAQLLKELEDTVLKRPLIGLEFSPFPGIPDQVHVRQTDAQFIQLNIPEMVRELPAPYDALLEHVSASFALEGVIAAPLLGDDGVIATLLIAGSGLTPTDVPAVTAFARHASIAIQNARLQRQLQSDANRLHANVAARTAEVSQQKERLLAVLESAGSGIVITGPDGVMEYANPAWERLTGRSAATEIRNQVKIVDENTFPDLFSGRYGSRELTDRRPDGSGYSANVTVTPLFEKDKGGKRLGGLVVVYRDITEYKEIDRLKSQFLNTASHQLRTPLTTILGFSELLVSRPNLTQDERWRFLQHINDHAQRLKDLVEDLFDISQSESGGEIELDLSPLRLDTVLQKEIRLRQ